jgi:hypothetical protein
MDENDIPENLYAEDSQQPHQHCMICNTHLHEHANYGIQKVYKNYPDQEEPQVLFDFALCMPCMEKARAELSIESRQRIDAFMRSKMLDLSYDGIDPRERYKEKQCTLSGQALSEAGDYQVMAICSGNKLIDSPIYISGEILEEIHELLSAKSKDELDRFTENNLDWPPELKALIKQGDWLPL